ncbi:MAG: CAP domain-containing protein [Bacillota bacterium]|nr:CAP domain-containing protein [Bacillota bacterium]
MQWLKYVSGFICGAMVFCAGSALAAGPVVQLSGQAIYVDGQQVALEAYNIDGNNYVKLRDVGQAVDFNVYWQDGVQIESEAPYTGEAPLGVAEAPLAGTPTQEDSMAEVRQEMAALTNEFRLQNGLGALPVDDMLSRAAQVRAEEMAAAGLYSHTRPDGRNYNTVTDAFYTAEIIHRISGAYLDYKGTGLAKEAVGGWIGSQAHRDIMLESRVVSMGVGLAPGLNDQGRDCWYCVQLFCLEGYTVTWVDQPAAGN